jgi:hypothetical protein
MYHDLITKEEGYWGQNRPVGYAEIIKHRNLEAARKRAQGLSTKSANHDLVFEVYYLDINGDKFYQYMELIVSFFDGDEFNVRR